MVRLICLVAVVHVAWAWDHLRFASRRTAAQFAQGVLAPIDGDEGPASSFAQPFVANLGKARGTVSYPRELHTVKSRSADAYWEKEHAILSRCHQSLGGRSVRIRWRDAEYVLANMWYLQ